MSEAKIKSNKSKLKHRLADVLANGGNNVVNGHQDATKQQNKRRSLSTVTLQSSANQTDSAIGVTINKSYSNLTADASSSTNNPINNTNNSDLIDYDDLEYTENRRLYMQHNANNTNANINHHRSSFGGCCSSSSSSSAKQFSSSSTTTANKSNSPNYSITADDIEAFNRINKEDLFVENSRWLSEKPISVLQLDLADRAVLKIADQRDKIQKKTFTKWINKHLKKVSVQVNELFDDLRDGINLILLLEVLTNRVLIKIVNIRPDEIVDGNPKLTLGLIWIIILHFQISDINLNENFNREATAKDTLMNWVNQTLDCYPGLEIKDFSHSWKNGKALLAILHRFIPEKINIEQIKRNDNKRNLQLAFDLAESEFNVCKLLDPEDVDVGTPDEKSIITYVSSLYNAMPRNIPPVRPGMGNPFAGSIMGKEKKGLFQEYSMLYKSLSRWLNESIKLMDGSPSNLPNDYIDLKSLMADLKSFRLEEYPLKQKDKKKLNYIYSELHNIYSKQFAQTIDSNENIKVLDALWEKLDQAIQNRETQLEQAIYRFEKMQKTFDKLNRETKNLGENLNILKEQFTMCMSRLKSSTNSTNPTSIGNLKASTSTHKLNNHIHSTPLFHTSDFRKTIDTINTSIRQNEITLRQYLIDAQKLKEENYPNSESLIQKLSKLERCTIDLLVQIKSETSTTPNAANNEPSQLSSSILNSSQQQPSTSLGDTGIVADSSQFQTPQSTSLVSGGGGGGSVRTRHKGGSRRGSKKANHLHSPPPPTSSQQSAGFDTTNINSSSISNSSLLSSMTTDCGSSGVSSMNHHVTPHQLSDPSSYMNHQLHNYQHQHHHYQFQPAAQLLQSPLYTARLQHDAVCITTTTTTTTAAAVPMVHHHHPAAPTTTSLSTFGGSTSSPSSILSSFSSTSNTGAVAALSNGGASSGGGAGIIITTGVPNARLCAVSYAPYDIRSPISSFSSTSSASSSVSKQLCDLISDANRWITNKQNTINMIQYKADIALNEIELSRVRQIAVEAKKFHTQLEQIELLKMEHVESNELNAKVNEIFTSFNHLCKTIKSAQSHLDSLMEFNKLIQDELRFISEMEDIELNRDWSQPKKLKSNDLIKHKMNVEMTMHNKKPKLNTIINFAERLIEARHPASDDLQGYISTLNSETIWLQQLMCLLGIHISELQQFEKFDKDFSELNKYLNDVQVRLDHLASSSLNMPQWPKATCDEFAKQFGVFKHNFGVLSNPRQQIDRLYDMVNTKLPAYKMRRANLTPPYDSTHLLTDYYLVECKFSKGELCKIVDNSNQVKWKVLSAEKNRDAFIPSVCFSIRGPDPDLVEQVDKLKLKYDQISESIERFEAYLRKESLCQAMRSLVKEGYGAYDSHTLESAVRNVRDQVDAVLRQQQQRSNEPGSNLLAELKTFEAAFRPILYGEDSDNNNTTSNSNEIEAMMTMMTNANANAQCEDNQPLDLVERKLRRLYERFHSLVCASTPPQTAATSLIIIKQYVNPTTTTAATSSNANNRFFVRRNFNVEVLLQKKQIIN